MKSFHLDAEYRNRWQEFHLANGTVEDSRVKNWRQVAWGQVILITAYLLGHVHKVDCAGPGFLAFLNFRWGGQEPTYDGLGKYTGHRRIRIWTIGWTDGRTCFLKDIDFYTGRFIKRYQAPLSQFQKHLHPDVRDKVLSNERQK